MLFVPITARASFCIRELSSLVHFEEEMKASESGPCCVLISENLRATRPRASSQLASRNLSPSRIRGLVRRSGAFTKSQPNFPFTQVEIPFVGPSAGSTFGMWRSLVQTSKLQPTPQSVHTVLVRRMRDSRMADSISDTRMMAPYPVSGSTSLTTSIMPSSARLEIPVRNPAWPSMDFSISALHGQTVMQWPQETQLDSPMVDPPSHCTRGWGSSQLMERVSFTWTFWQASTQRPQRMHWSGS